MAANAVSLLADRQVCGAAVESTKERRRSEESPGLEPRERVGVVGQNASVVRGRVQAQRGE